MNPSSAQSSILRLLAPLDGRIVPLDKVPDPVFAQRIVGDGVSIDPTSSVVLAPCAGEVLHAHAAGHALTLRGEEGLEIMIHVGVDTVQLKGEGFALKVRLGDRVAAGQELLRFDADLVARKAKSLLTQLLVTNVDRVGALTHPDGDVRAGRDAALEVSLRAAAPQQQAQAGVQASSDAILISNPTGLHARPAALFAQEAKRFLSSVRARRGDSEANAKSLVSIMALNVKQGDKVMLVAEGPDAREAVAALSRLLAGALDEPSSAPPPPRPQPAPAKPKDPRALGGVCAAPGLALGQAFQFRRAEAEVVEAAEDPAAARSRLARAVESAKAELEALQTRFAAESDKGKAAIFGAHRELLDDPELLAIAEAALAKGAGAAAAWKCAYQDFASRLSRLNNELLAGRAVDVKDVGWRVLRLLTGAAPQIREFPQDCILLAEDLTPSDTASLDRGRVRGIATVGGGGTSHVAILCRALELPALAALPPALLAVPDGAPLILDADRGFLLTEPTPAETDKALASRNAARRRQEADLAAAAGDARTKDGRRVRVAANVGKAADAQAAARLGAEGVGLCRSEFLFLEREQAPGEEEQREAYAAIAAAFPRSEVIIRALDVGGDKHLPYLAMAKEQNPFLGERGIRLLLERPEILRTQLRALLRASQAGGMLKVMFPMVANLSEFRAARAILDEEAKLLDIPAIPCGVMIEVPSAALLSAHLAAEAAFFSIGTNDLTQYTLAMDRGNPKMAARVDALDPAVLLMIQRTVEGALVHGRHVGVCGGAAGDVQAIPLLIGLGVEELSVSPSAVPAVKAAVRRADYAECRRLAGQAVALGSAAEVRALIARQEVAA
ncbi:MAG: phosphoenolpyruvate--protein phosphotransferase [Elusimicrobia bacterium]|nr:phosphoenolpyruvate--protein phosphotransferase [Elusimicrobiota bacterium]